LKPRKQYVPISVQQPSVQPPPVLSVGQAEQQQPHQQQEKKKKAPRVKKVKPPPPLQPEESQQQQVQENLTWQVQEEEAAGVARKVKKPRKPKAPKQPPKADAAAAEHALPIGRAPLPPPGLSNFGPPTAAQVPSAIPAEPKLKKKRPRNSNKGKKNAATAPPSALIETS
jgi:hypothetical protein